MNRAPEQAEQQGANLVIITGLSGSGKGTVLKALEDAGFYAVDNLPVELIPKFAELVQQAHGIGRAALVVDIREAKGLKDLPRIYKRLKQNCRVELVFLEASNEVLLRRFSETRRPHPLADAEDLLASIERERQRLAAIRKLASEVIDTTPFTVHELRRFVARRFAGGSDVERLLVYVTSFGYRYGIPPHSDLVFDVRFLPNPHYVADLRPLTGKHTKVIHYMESFSETREFLSRLEELLSFLLPRYAREDKSYVTIAFGCTAGRHRSVMIAEAIARRLQEKGFAVRCTHRDIRRGQAV